MTKKPDAFVLTCSICQVSETEPEDVRAWSKATGSWSHRLCIAPKTELIEPKPKRQPASRCPTCHRVFYNKPVNREVST